MFALAGDPVGIGLVASLARPGGNVTGLSMQPGDLAGKRIELLREVVPGSPPVGDHGQCRHPDTRAGNARGQARRTRSASKSSHSKSGEAEDIAPAFEALKGRADCALCCRRRARKHQPGPHQHLGARRATADDYSTGSTSKREV